MKNHPYVALLTEPILKRCIENFVRPQFSLLFKIKLKLGRFFLFISTQRELAKFPTKAIDYVGLYEAFSGIASPSHSFYTNWGLSYGTEMQIEGEKVHHVFIGLI